MGTSESAAERSAGGAAGTNAGQNAEASGQSGARERPQPDWVRGVCPRCGAELVSNSYYVAGRGYLVLWECWSSLGDTPTCDYRRAL